VAPPRMLVVDDDALVLRAITRYIESLGAVCEVRAALGGEEALDVLSSYSPDVAIIDLNMPIVSGRVVAQAIIAQRSPCVVVVFSATSPEIETINALYRMGVSFVMDSKGTHGLLSLLLESGALPHRPPSRPFSVEDIDR